MLWPIDPYPLRNRSPYYSTQRTRRGRTHTRAYKLVPLWIHEEKAACYICSGERLKLVCEKRFNSHGVQVAGDQGLAQDSIYNPTVRMAAMLGASRHQSYQDHDQLTLRSIQVLDTLRTRFLAPSIAREPCEPGTFGSTESLEIPQ